jgi:hypothetical protein
MKVMMMRINASPSLLLGIMDSNHHFFDKKKLLLFKNWKLTIRATHLNFQNLNHSKRSSKKNGSKRREKRIVSSAGLCDIIKNTIPPPLKRRGGC